MWRRYAGAGTVIGDAILHAFTAGELPPTAERR